MRAEDWPTAREQNGEMCSSGSEATSAGTGKEILRAPRWQSLCVPSPLAQPTVFGGAGRGGGAQYVPVSRTQEGPGLQHAFFWPLREFNSQLTPNKKCFVRKRKTRWRGTVRLKDFRGLSTGPNFLGGGRMHLKNNRKLEIWIVEDLKALLLFFLGVMIKARVQAGSLAGTGCSPWGWGAGLPRCHREGGCGGGEGPCARQRC